MEEETHIKSGHKDTKKQGGDCLPVGAYYRVSTRDKEQNPEMQKKVVEDYCEHKNIQIVKEYTDDGVSGSKASRPAWDELLADMRDGKFEGIVCYKMDRIGRSFTHLVKLFEEFDSKKIHFISATQNFNTTTPEGKLMLRMMMILTEYERELTIDRILDGLALAKSKGKKLGRIQGSKDKKPRRRAGYNLRWMKEKKKR